MEDAVDCMEAYRARLLEIQKAGEAFFRCHDQAESKGDDTHDCSSAHYDRNATRLRKLCKRGIDRPLWSRTLAKST